MNSKYLNTNKLLENMAGGLRKQWFSNTSSTVLRRVDTERQRRRVEWVPYPFSSVSARARCEEAHNIKLHQNMILL